MGISLILGGSKPLPGWFGALLQWKLKLTWAFACVKEGVKACQDALCTYDKKSDEGSNSVRMRHENSGASTVVENWLPTRVSDSSDAQLSDYV